MWRLGKGLWLRRPRMHDRTHAHTDGWIQRTYERTHGRTSGHYAHTHTYTHGRVNGHYVHTNTHTSARAHLHTRPDEQIQTHTRTHTARQTDITRTETHTHTYTYGRANGHYAHTNTRTLTHTAGWTDTHTHKRTLRAGQTDITHTQTHTHGQTNGYYARTHARERPGLTYLNPLFLPPPLAPRSPPFPRRTFHNKKLGERCILIIPQATLAEIASSIEARWEFDLWLWSRATMRWRCWKKRR